MRSSLLHRFISVTIISVGLITTESRAESCGDVDLRENLGAVRNQGDIGWCYANAAADLLSYGYQKELKTAQFLASKKNNPNLRIEDIGPVQISAAHIALNYNRFFWSSADKEGGFIRLSTKIATKSGMCIQAQDKDLVTNYPLKQSIKYMVSLKQLYDSERNSARFEQQMKFMFGSQGLFPGLDVGLVKSVLAKSSARKFAENLTALVCGERSFKEPYELDFESNQKLGPFMLKAEPLLVTIDRRLDRKNIIGISYFANFLTSKNGRKEGMHASVIVGRRKNRETGSCEYLIRNSWGPSCSHYRTPLNITPEQARGGVSYCELGNIWVDSKSISTNVLSVDWVKDN